LYEESSQVRVPAFANPQQLLLAPGAIFARDDSEPRGKPSPFFASGSIADRGNDQGLLPAVAGFVLASGLVDHGIGFVDAHLPMIEPSFRRLKLLILGFPGHD
jgi:hypothetical protein